MSRNIRWCAFAGLLVASLVLPLAGCKTSPDEVDESVEPTGPFADLQKKVAKSDQLPGWKRSGDMAVLTGTGYTVPATATDVPPHAPLNQNPTFQAKAPLLAEYKHQVSVVQSFESEGDTAGTIRLEIHEMNNADDAYGLVSISESGEQALGSWTIGRKAAGRLVFAKDAYVVRVTGTGVADEKALSTVAPRVAMRISGRMRVPWVVEKLPVPNRVPGTIVYLHGPLGLKMAEARFGVSMVPTLGPVLGNAPMAAVTYRSAEGNDNTVFIVNRRDSTETPPIDHLENYMATAPADVLNRFVYALADNRYVIVGSFNAEEESVQRVIARIVDNLNP